MEPNCGDVVSTSGKRFRFWFRRPNGFDDPAPLCGLESSLWAIGSGAHVQSTVSRERAWTSLNILDEWKSRSWRCCHCLEWGSSTRHPRPGCSKSDGPQ